MVLPNQKSLDCVFDNKKRERERERERDHQITKLSSKTQTSSRLKAYGAKVGGKKIRRRKLSRTKEMKIS